MTNYNDGKIHGWNGGDCPVHPSTLVKLFYMSIVSNLDYKAKNVYWGHSGGCGDLVAFQVVKEYKEPMVVWMNLYNYGCAYIYKTKEEAIESSGKGTQRIAIKLIEVQE